MVSSFPLPWFRNSIFRNDLIENHTWDNSSHCYLHDMPHPDIPRKFPDIRLVYHDFPHEGLSLFFFQKRVETSPVFCAPRSITAALWLAELSHFFIWGADAADQHENDADDLVQTWEIQLCYMMVVWVGNIEFLIRKWGTRGTLFSDRPKGEIVWRCVLCLEPFDSIGLPGV